MIKFLFFILIIFSSSLQSSEFLCTQKRETLEERYFKTMLEMNPYCLSEVKRLKKEPITNQKDFNLKVQEEVDFVLQNYNQRKNNDFEAISTIVKSLRKKGEHSPFPLLYTKNNSLKGFVGDCDKLKHCSVSCKLAYSCGFYGSRAIGRFKEVFFDFILGKGSADFEDIVANEVGLNLSKNIIQINNRTEDIYSACENACIKNITRLHTVYYDYKNEHHFCR